MASNESRAFGRAIHFLTFPTICKWRMEAEGRQPRDLRIPLALGPSKLFGGARGGGKTDTLRASIENPLSERTPPSDLAGQA